MKLKTYYVWPPEYSLITVNATNERAARRAAARYLGRQKLPKGTELLRLGDQTCDHARGKID